MAKLNSSKSFNKKDYIQLSGNLFNTVQNQRIFPDSMTFVDSVPLSSPEEIKKKFEASSTQTEFNLEQFIRRNFAVPSENNKINLQRKVHSSMQDYIENLWDDLCREPSDIDDKTTLIPLPHRYIVPGGRFREIYYWDSFFTSLGLIRSGKIDVAKSMCENFRYLVETFGFIPNGNRIYYTTRSQPPFYALLIDLISKYEPNYFVDHLESLEKEYNFWMNGAGELDELGNSFRRVVKLQDGTILNRYFDDDSVPREEAYFEDTHYANLKTNEDDKRKLYLDFRAGAESGWDFCSRWLQDPNDLGSIITTDILPVDLNSLLYFVELKLSEWFGLQENFEKCASYKAKSEKRLIAIQKYFWNEDKKFFMDYNWKKKTSTDCYSLASVYPLFFNIATNEQAKSVRNLIEEKFLKTYGLMSTLTFTNQQWDGEKGWAPLQWLSIQALKNYGFHELANTIKTRWLENCERVFNLTGEMFEKYNVLGEDLGIGDGGEYPVQHGFGWTNGVALDLMELN